MAQPYTKNYTGKCLWYFYASYGRDNRENTAESATHTTFRSRRVSSRP